MDTTKQIDLGLKPMIKVHQLKFLRTKFLPELVRKFSNVRRDDEVKDVSFLTSDRSFGHALYRVFNQLRDDYFEDDADYRRQEIEIIANHPRMFYTFRKILEVAMKRYPDVRRQPEEEQGLDGDATHGYFITSIFVSGSDRSEVFGNRMSYEPCLVELFVQFLSKARTGYFEENLNAGSKVLLSNSLTILHNCAVHKSNHEQLVRAGVLETTKSFLVKKDGKHESEIVQIVAFLADDSDAHLFRMKEDVLTDEMAARLREGMKTTKRAAGGWNVWELLRGFSRLALNDKNRSVMKECGLIGTLVELLRSEVKDEQREAASVLLAMKSDSDIKDTIEGNSDTMRRISELTSSPPDAPKATLEKDSKPNWSLDDLDLD